MPHKDLREWLRGAEALGELKVIRGADWNLEMGAIAEVASRELKPPPAILFDDIPGYPSGRRALFGMVGSPRRFAMTMDMPTVSSSMLEFLREFRRRTRQLNLIPPRFLPWGPIMENVATGDNINLLDFPVPWHHEHDGGRYMGTGHLCITRDPDEGWVNLGTYRVMLVDHDRLAFHAMRGRHGDIHRIKFLERNKPCPVAISFGHDPALFVVSSSGLPWGISEYDYCGGIRGEPVEVVEGPTTGLPIPAYSEVAIEGEIHPETVPEGPFGEWAGYYANNGLEPVPEPTIRVKSLMYRNDPILTCAQPGRPPHDYSLAVAVYRSALLWDYLERAGVPDVQGVWCHLAGGTHLFNAVSIKQRYPGHARQAGHIAAQTGTGAFCGRYIVVVDEDIDPTNLEDVIWAMSTRSDPERSLDMMRRCYSGSPDPAIPLEEKSTAGCHNSRVVIDACRPYEWKDRFPPVVRVSQELEARVRDKWGETLGMAPRAIPAGEPVGVRA